MEKNLTQTYNTARDELTAKWQAFMKKQEPRVKKAYENLQAALKTGDTQTIFDAKIEYQRIMMNTTIQNNRYKNMVDGLTDKIANVNQTALDYINDNMPSIYTTNYNAFSTEQIKGYSFSLVNENAVRELMTTNKMLVPTKKKLDIPKDKRWNTKFINSQVTQGILQGESMQKIADRILPEIVSKSTTDLIKRNKAAAIRNARTMTTAAENKGRNDSFKQATKDGVILEREWIAAHDERTRDWHRELDGVKVGVDEPWENDFGEIMFPGDPTADAANVYNCRCAIRAHVKGFNWSKNKAEITSNYESNISLANIKSSKPQVVSITYENMVNEAVKTSNSLPLVQKNIQKGVERVSFLSGVSEDEARRLLNSKLADIVDNSEIGMSITKDSLLKAIKDKRFKNVYESGTSTYNTNLKFRNEAEEIMFNIKSGLTRSIDRPIYGALMPKLEDGLRAENYYKQGPVAKYGDGITVLFNKDKIIESCTMGMGDSLNYASRIGVSSLSNPEYAAAYNMGATIGLSRGYGLMDIADRADHYFEVQIFGGKTHSTKNISSIIISESRVKDADELIKILEGEGFNVTRIK